MNYFNKIAFQLPCLQRPPFQGGQVKMVSMPRFRKIMKKPGNGDLLPSPLALQDSCRKMTEILNHSILLDIKKIKVLL